MLLLVAVADGCLVLRAVCCFCVPACLLVYVTVVVVWCCCCLLSLVDVVRCCGWLVFFLVL